VVHQHKAMCAPEHLAIKCYIKIYYSDLFNKLVGTSLNMHTMQKFVSACLQKCADSWAQFTGKLSHWNTSKESCHVSRWCRVHS